MVQYVYKTVVDYDRFKGATPRFGSSALKDSVLLCSGWSRLRHRGGLKCCFPSTLDHVVLAANGLAAPKIPHDTGRVVVAARNCVLLNAVTALAR